MVKPKDWHQSRNGKYTRIDLLKILFLGKDMVRGLDGINNRIWEEKVSSCFSYFQMSIPWKDTREVLKNMKKKYQSEQSHDAFNAFYADARNLWSCLLYTSPSPRDS